MKPRNIILLSVLLIITLTCISVSYSSPDKSIVINKNHQKGYLFTIDIGYGCIYPNYHIKTLSIWGIKTISLTEKEFKKVNKWKVYNSKHDLFMYQ